MNEPFQLVTNCTFNGKDYLVQMCVFTSKKLELTVTDKLMAEDWQCEYDATYIEALTHKTGNFKNFEVFVMMLKSGLLKTSDCITLDLLTIEDLEELRNKKVITSYQSSKMVQSGKLNKRYLILTYTVEFDRIHYPLPLDYCGPPDPAILQCNIRRLEAEVQRLKQKTFSDNRCDSVETRKLKERIEHLMEDNSFLSNEIRRLNKLLAKTSKPMRSNQVLQNTLRKLEEQVLHEKSNFRHTVWKLKEENRQLKLQIEELKTSEKCLKLRLKNASKNSFQMGPKRTKPDSLSPQENLDRRRNVRGERRESQLTGPGISNWNRAILTKSLDSKSVIKRLESRKTRSRSSSESGSNKPEKLELEKARTLTPTIQRSKGRNFIRQLSARKSSGERSRHSSSERHSNLCSQTCNVDRISRLYKGRRDSSSCSDVRTRRKSCESSHSSRESSKNSKDFHPLSHGSGDHKFYKHTRVFKNTLDKEDLKLSVSDLESRIRALQKILSEGLNF